MTFRHWNQFMKTSVVWSSLCLVLLLLTACRSMMMTVRIDADITPAPVVGEIVTLHIETLSPEESGEGVFVIYYTEPINFLEIDPKWQGPKAAGDVDSLEWRGPVVAGEHAVHEFTLCVTKPGNWAIHIQGGVAGKEHGGNTLHITSTADSAQVIPSSEYEVHQPPFGSTPIPTPEPVTVSPECAGV